MSDLTAYKIAVILPCYNESAAIATVVKDFQKELPAATVYVFDNNSTDDTAAVARKAGATVFNVPTKGKGNVVRHMFADVDADIYIMADGDDTYTSSDVTTLVNKLVDENLDMVVGRRIPEPEAYRPKHEWGNLLFNRVVATLFGNRMNDIFSGYRIFSRRFVKSFPSMSTGFEIETELTVHALELNLPVAEIDSVYKARAEGTQSKLRTYHDGARILAAIFHLFKEEQPLKFFTAIFVLLSIISLGFGLPVVADFVETGIVPRMPTAFLSATIGVLAFISLTCGFILDSVARARKEAKRLAYLKYPCLSNMKNNNK